MTKEEKIEMSGMVVKALGNAVFRVQLDDAHEMSAHISGK
ncbi:translation initiation factor IF-1, partial [bacterium]|nr:translation initiation factor IF-1 [bacterium]